MHPGMCNILRRQLIAHILPDIVHGGRVRFLAEGLEAAADSSGLTQVRPGRAPWEWIGPCQWGLEQAAQPTV